MVGDERYGEENQEERKDRNLFHVLPLSLEIAMFQQPIASETPDLSN